MGAWVGLDDLIAGAIGATIGVVSQGIIDVINGELSNASTYFAAGLGGAVGGISSLYIGPALGMGLGAATANITDRIADSLLDNGKYEGDTFCDAALDVLIDASIGLASGSIAKLVKVNGLNVKRNSWKAISQSTFTKLKNRSIHRIKSKTYYKMLGYETWQSAPFNIYNISKNTISELPNGELITPQQYPVLDYYFFEYSSTTEIIIKTGNGIYYEKRVEYIYFEKVGKDIQYNGRILVD